MLKYSTFLLVIVAHWACKQNLTQDDADFKISNVQSIHRIDIQSKNYDQQKLVKKNDRWILNDSIKVRPDAIENIFRILPTLKVMNYPPKAAWENIIETIGSEGGKISFFDRNGQLIKSMNIGGTTNDERGTYALLTGAVKPFIVNVPGFHGNLGTRLFMDNTSWRDRMIIDILPNEILNVKMEYLEDKNASFEIEYKNTHIIVYDNKGNRVLVNESVVKSYLDGFKQVGSESIENEFRNKSYVLLDKPHAILELTSVDNTTRKIYFYPNRLEGDADVERMFVYDGRDFYLAQNRILMRLFRPLSYFQGK